MPFHFCILLDCKYFKYISKEGCKVQKKKFRQLKKFVKEHSWVSLKLADTWLLGIKSLDFSRVLDDFDVLYKTSHPDKQLL